MRRNAELIAIRVASTTQRDRTRSCGAIRKSWFRVHAAAYTSSYRNKSGLMKMRNLVLWQNGGTPPLMLATYAGQSLADASG